MEKTSQEACTGTAKRTAAQKYARHQADIAILLDCIQMELDAHARMASEKPSDWGFPGDLAHVREMAKGMLKFLMVGKGKEEAEVDRMIEEHLETMREN